MKKLKAIPKFNSENEERNFWAKADSSEYLDFSQAQKIKFPKLKPSSKKISFRIPEYILDDLRQAANRRDIPYQSYLKEIIIQGLRKERMCSR